MTNLTLGQQALNMRTNSFLDFHMVTNLITFFENITEALIFQVDLVIVGFASFMNEHPNFTDKVFMIIFSFIT